MRNGNIHTVHIRKYPYCTYTIYTLALDMQYIYVHVRSYPLYHFQKFIIRYPLTYTMDSTAFFQLLDVGYDILQKMSNKDYWQRMISVTEYDDRKDWRETYWKAKNYFWPIGAYPKSNGRVSFLSMC